MMRIRSDVVFLLLTKRPGRFRDCLPASWGDGWDNVFLNVTCENQRRADERIPLLLDLPFRHKGLRCAPLLGPVSIAGHLDSGQIEQVACGGENYGGRRPCDFDWVRTLREECVARDITFCFMETGATFVRDGRTYAIRGRQLQNEQAFRSGMNHQGKPLRFELRDGLGMSVPAEELYIPHFVRKCQTCSFKMLCNGYGDCGRCEG